MDELLFVFNFSIAASALMLVSLCLLLVVFIKGQEPWSKKFFILFFSVSILYVIANMSSLFLDYYSYNVLISQIFLFVESLASSLLMPLLTIYLLHCCKEPAANNIILNVTGILWSVYFMLLTVTQFTDKIYYFSPTQGYRRGPWYPVLLVPPVLIMLFNLAALIRKREKLSRKQFYAFFIYLSVPMAAMLMQMCFYGLSLIVLATACSDIFLFLFIISDQVDQYISQQKELSDQRAKILVLQMRPHFIYNTMMSIYYLCAQNSQKAQQVILDFSIYLRKNFTAITKKETVPFSEELEHTRAYLAVEQVRFEGKLDVDFDTSHTNFRLPPLTLQPIVENAVKHGVDPERDPLRIHITTAAAENESIITVVDNGPGFDTANMNEPHIALTSVRERLLMMCGGTLEISSGRITGTIVTIHIPCK